MRFRSRHYEVEAAASLLPREAVVEHPLSLCPAHDSRGSASARHLSASSSYSSLELDEPGLPENAFFDPLRESVVADPMASPLSRSSRLMAYNRQSKSTADWDGYKASILQRFTSTGTITVSTNFDIMPKDLKGRGKSLTAAHLEELEDPQKEFDKEVKIISQQEYVTRLRELNDEIAQAWLNNERVAALRLSIKVAKLLSDTSVPQFYPTLFVLVTDVMDTVGNLVWNRIKGKAEMDEHGNVVGPLPENFTVDVVCKEAKDTCRNWFHKIGTIHELLPRIYLEIAIMRCLQFLVKGPPLAAFQRLTLMIRGLADPLASAYAHLYLARLGQVIIPSETGFLITGLDDYLLLFRAVLSGQFDKNIVKGGLSQPVYLSLVEPVFEWIMQCTFKHANVEEMIFLINTFGKQQNGLIEDQKNSTGPVSVMIHYLLKQLPAAVLSSHAFELTRIIRSSDDLSMAQYLNYRLLGEKLCEYGPPRDICLEVLNDVWKVVMKYSNLVEYLTVADVFIDYILQNCSEKELNVMLHDIMKHLKKAKVTEAALAVLESIIFKLMTYLKELRHLLSLPYFVNILDVFHGDIRVSVCKRIASSVSRNNQIIKDPVTQHFMFEICKSLHDSLDSLSSEDDRRQLARLIARFVQLVDFGCDLEQHLSFLVDCRGTFANMDLIRETVVHLSNRIATDTLRLLKGNHSSHSVEFVKSCVTFNEITIPSINIITKRVDLYLETAEVALMNGLLSHVEGLTKSSITCLQEVQNVEEAKRKEIEEEGFICIRKLCSFLVLVPGHPDLGPFYLLRGLINLLNTQPWFQGQYKVQILCGILSICSTLHQGSLPYHVQSMEVASNDELFFGEPAYNEELLLIMNEVVEDIISSLDQVTDMIHGQQALDLCNLFITTFVGDDELNALCTSLFKTAIASLPKQNGYLHSTLSFAKSRGLTLTA